MSVYVRVCAPPQVIRAQQTRAHAPSVVLEEFDEAVGKDVGDGPVHGSGFRAVGLELVEPLLALCPHGQDEEEEGREEEHADAFLRLPDVVQHARRVIAQVGVDFLFAPHIPHRALLPVYDRDAVPFVAAR